MKVTRRFWRFMAALALATLTALPAAAAPKAATLSAQDKADIGRAEAYLNAITTLKARFLQVSSSGGTAEGTAYLWRPGRLRLSYDPPSPVLVIADGEWLIYHDIQLKQTSYAGLDSTPAGVLVRPQVQFVGKEVVVTRVARAGGVLNISLVQAADPGSGEITLIFTDKPFELRKWQVTDAQGTITTVSLFDAQAGLTLDPALFKFHDEKFFEKKAK